MTELKKKIPEIDLEITNEAGFTGTLMTGWKTSADDMFKMSDANFKAMVLTWITAAQVGLANVDNTSDADKPISTATQTAIDNILALLASDELTLDTLQEIVDFIQVNADDLANLGIANIAGLQAALDAKIAIASIIDNLTSVLTNQPLSAAQGKVLKDLIDGLPAATQTLTNKRITKRVQSTTGGSTTITSDTVDELNAYGLTSTLTLPNPSGTPTEGQDLLIKIRDNGVSKTVTWSGANWRAMSGITLPTATTASKTYWILALWNSNDSKWDVVAVKTQS